MFTARDKSFGQNFDLFYIIFSNCQKTMSKVKVLGKKNTDQVTICIFSPKFVDCSIDFKHKVALHCQGLITLLLVTLIKFQVVSTALSR